MRVEYPNIVDDVCLYKLGVNIREEVSKQLAKERKSKKVTRFFDDNIDVYLVKGRIRSIEYIKENLVLNVDFQRNIKIFFRKEGKDYTYIATYTLSYNEIIKVIIDIVDKKTSLKYRSIKQKSGDTIYFTSKDSCHKIRVDDLNISKVLNIENINTLNSLNLEKCLKEVLSNC